MYGNELFLADTVLHYLCTRTQDNYEQNRSTYFQIAGVRVELNQLREKLDEAIQSQDFAAAAEIKAQVNELEDKKECLISENVLASQEIRQEKVQNKLL